MPEPKAKPMYALRVEAQVAHHLRVHLARARHLQPAALSGPLSKRDVDLGARLGEREVARPEAQLQLVGLEERLHEVEEHRPSGP